MNKKIFSSILKILLKVGFSLGLVYWLISSGKLDLSTTKVFIDKPSILFFNMGFWIFGIVALCGCRWYVLLKGIGLNPTLKRTIQLHATGLFFNTAIPGAVGGDLIKAIYIFKDQTESGKTHALLSVFLDRLIGLYGLFTIATIAMFFQLDLVQSNPAISSLFIFVLGIFSSMTFFFIAVFFPFPENKDPIANFFTKPWPLFSIAHKVYVAFRLYRQNKRSLFLAYLMSILFQFCFIYFYYYIAQTIVPMDIPIFSFFAIIPVGMLVIAIPISPGGLGVGHAAFDKLFLLIGINNGANVFNIAFIGITALNLIGAIPYLMLKTKSIKNT